MGRPYVMTRVPSFRPTPFRPTGFGPKLFVYSDSRNVKHVHIRGLKYVDEEVEEVGMGR